MVLDFPRLTPAVAPAPTRTNLGDLTALELFLERAVAAPVVTVVDARMHVTARRLMQQVTWHELDILTDPEHRPGSRRDNALWRDLDRMTRPNARASIKTVARSVIAHLPEHEARLLADCLRIGA